MSDKLTALIDAANVNNARVMLAMQESREIGNRVRRGEATLDDAHEAIVRLCDLRTSAAESANEADRAGVVALQEEMRLRSEVFDEVGLLREAVSALRRGDK
jgi:hypothetical protein